MAEAADEEVSRKLVVAKERSELPRCGSVRAIPKPPAKPTDSEMEEAGASQRLQKPLN